MNNRIIALEALLAAEKSAHAVTKRFLEISQEEYRTLAASIGFNLPTEEVAPKVKKVKAAVAE